MSRTVRAIALLLTVGWIGCLHADCQAQDHSLDVYGVVEGGISIPAEPRGLPATDQKASEEVARYLRTTGGARWSDLKATGTMSYPLQKAGPFNVEMSILGENRFRLDEDTPAGRSSMRARGAIGDSAVSNGKPRPFQNDAAYLGLVQFPQLNFLEKTRFPHALIDRGYVTVKERRLRQISLEIEHPPLSLFDQGHKHIAVIDFYFDAATHLLAKSVSVIREEETGPQKILRVVDYSDYRKVGEAILPFHCEESRNGRTYWVLQLSQISLNNNPPLSDFTLSGETR